MVLRIKSKLRACAASLGDGCDKLIQCTRVTAVFPAQEGVVFSSSLSCDLWSSTVRHVGNQFLGTLWNVPSLNVIAEVPSFDANFLLPHVLIMPPFHDHHHHHHHHHHPANQITQLTLSTARRKTVQHLRKLGNRLLHRCPPQKLALTLNDSWPQPERSFGEGAFFEL